jgi:periplasmic protein TonB
MKPDMILKAELLDILFEDRNKEYGAYTLRKEYNERMAKAMSVMLGLVLLFVFGNYWMNQINPKENDGFGFTIKDTVEIINVEFPSKPIEPPPPQKKIATLQHVVPKIVPDTEEPTPTPEITELEKDVQIGTETHDGDKPSTLASQPSGHETVTPAATIAPEPEAPTIETHADVMPEFPGGNAALQRFLLKNLRFDFDEQEPGTRIEIRCRFVVDVNGNVSDAEIVKSAGKNTYDKEVTRVVGKMPQWKPGIKRNKNVAVYFTLPVIVEVPEQ